MKNVAETIQTAHREYVESSPTMIVDAVDLRIGDIILPIDNGEGTIRYQGFYLSNGDIASFDDDFEGRLTVTGSKVDQDDHLTIWAELVWYGEPNEDNSGYFVYREECDAYPANYLPVEIMRR